MQLSMISSTVALRRCRANPNGCSRAGADGDLAEAEAAIERLAAAPADGSLIAREIWLSRLRALLARAQGDAATHAHFRDRYREMAGTLCFEGHIAWADTMA